MKTPDLRRATSLKRPENHVLHSMRILIVTHAPLAAEFGACQMAINLSDALRAQGHDVTLWSPHPLPPDTRWWQTLRQMRSKLDDFIRTQRSFDVIDCPATFITRQISKAAPVIARSTQPEILYIVNGLNKPTKEELRKLIRLPFDSAYTLYHLFLVLQGWRRSRHILCLGSLELQWMKKWFPWWRGKLTSYFNALSTSDQEALAAVRRQRKKRSTDGLRFLWIGRWTAHKGTDVLLDLISKWLILRPQDTFTIAGCGSGAEKDCARQLLQSGKIKIIPSFERKELYSLLADNDVGLFTSKVEGWGLVLNEMLESGMPVFATQSGGTEDLQPFFKTLIPFPPPVELTLTDRELEIPINYYDTFNWSQVAKMYVTLASAS
ncbi:MAG: glycosyltransferase family 4 protein [Pyrinomonadaceae bacterium]|nr:glycosyltransferase family 4 protein [Pyrinomonadaceae bacterium]